MPGLAGCSTGFSTGPQPNTATVTVLYGLPPERVAEAMLEALAEVPVRITSQFQDVIEARSAVIGMPGSLRVELDETEDGGTRAVLSSDYINRGTLISLPMRLIDGMRRTLPSCPATLVPEVYAGAQGESCAELVVHRCTSSDESDAEPGDSVAEEMPDPIGGLEELQRKVRYPAEARRAGVEGAVLVTWIVDEEGVPRCIGAASGLTHGLNEAAMEAVADTRFTPGTRDGVPVEVRMWMPVRFRVR